MDALVKMMDASNLSETIKMWRHIEKTNGVHVFNVDVNIIIRTLLKSYLMAPEMGYLFYLASNVPSRPATHESISLSVKDIKKIIKYICREQRRELRELRISGLFDNGLPF
jgi:hypothetical protein